VGKPMAHMSPSRRASPTVTDLDAMIAEAEDARDFYRGFLERAEAAGLGLRRGQTLLRRAEERLVQLGRKRDMLLGRDGQTK
jgi:IS4 transposase